MPELPEVETVRRGLAPAMAGRRIARIVARPGGLRFPFPEDFAGRLTGRRVTGLRRRAKYLLADLDDGATLIAHLGMSGSFRVERGGEAETPGAFHVPRDGRAKHDHVVLDLEGGTRVVYNDPRRFGFMDLAPTASLDANPHLAGLGIEPLGAAFDAQALIAALAGAKTSLKAALLHQGRIAGLGNIYVCEALHRARLSPERGADTLASADGRPGAGAAALAGAIRDVLTEALAAGGSTLRDHRLADGTLGYFQHSFRVYGREGQACPTPNCRGTTARIVQNGRSTFFCRSCQK